MGTIFKYSICSTSGHRVTSDAMLAEYARQGRMTPDSLLRLLAQGQRYSYEDYDVLAAAMVELGNTEELWQRLSEPSPVTR